jgi:hypothetical protein
MAITACVPKLSTSSICFSVDRNDTDQFIRFEHWHTKIGPDAGGIDRGNCQWVTCNIGLIGSQIGKMDRLPGLSNAVEWSLSAVPGHHAAAPLAGVSLCQHTVEGGISETVSLAEPHGSVARLTKAHRVRQYCLKDWLQFTRRCTFMMRSTPAAAVCCSNASPRSVVRWRNSLSSRAFSIAMTACAAKFWTCAICLLVNGRTS